jgi:hypothetical protein
MLEDVYLLCVTRAAHQAVVVFEALWKQCTKIRDSQEEREKFWP